MTRLKDDTDRTDQLTDSRRLLLTTYAPDGTPRQDLCKMIVDRDGLGVLLRNSSAAAASIRSRRGVLVTACDAHGRPTGEQWAARATLCTPVRTVEYRIALMNKYGLITMLGLAMTRLTEGLGGTTGVRLTPAGRNWPVFGPNWRPTADYSLN
jgi:PPOX class probable F420-dependent enzyme